MKKNKHSLKISRSCGDITLDGYPIATYSNDGTQILVAVTFLKEALRSSSEKNCLGKMSLSNLKENK